MDPTGLLRPDQVSYMRFLERRGGFASQQTLILVACLVAWQVAQCLDLLEADQVSGAKDVLGLLLLMLDQTSQDKGS